MIQTKEENPKGLHIKYQIRKVVGVTDVKGSFGHRKRFKTKPVDKNAEYFVLRLDENQKDIYHLHACRFAIQAYADAIEKVLPDLALDLRERYKIAQLVDDKGNPIRLAR